MKQTFLHRYLQGDYEQVWAELIQLGEQVCQEPLRTDAQAVVNETMQRARYNIERIIRRLQHLNYQFAAPNWYPDWNTPGWSPSGHTTTALLSTLQARYGSLPLSLIGWISHVGFVNLMGFHPMLSTYRPIGESPLIWYADPLVVTCEIDENDSVTDISARNDNDSSQYIEIAPCFFHKSGYSGSGVVKLELPNNSIDCILRDDAGRWTGVPFNVFIRAAFQWGGFPGFDPHEWGELTFFHEGFDRDPNARERAADILVFLTENLLPL